MRVLVIFAFVQLAGISSIAMAQEPAGLTAALNRFDSFLDNIDYNILKTQYTEHLELAKAKCERNGGPNAHNLAVEGARTYFNSIIPLQNTFKSEIRGAATYEPNRRLDFTIQKTCAWARSMDHFSNDFVTSFGHCWTLAERNSVHRLKTLTFSLLNYICENEGSHIREFINANGYDCVVSKSTDLGTCFNNSGSTNIFPIQSYDRTVQRPWSTPVIVATNHFCLEFANLQRCSVTALHGCVNSAPANIINSVFDIVKESLGCDTLVNAHTTPATDN